MPLKRGLGKGLAQASGQKPNANKILKIANPNLTEKLIALEKARRIKEVEKIPFAKRYASPKEVTAFHTIVQKLREIDEKVQIAPEDMSAAKRVLELGKGQNQSRIRKADVKSAFALLKKYGPIKTRR
jgi:hypothetical protein